MTGACPVTTDLNMRVNVRTTTCRNHHLFVETIHLELRRAQQGQTAPFSGILRWAGGACGMNAEWRTRVDCTKTSCRRPSLLSNTETIKWRTVCVSIPMIRNNRMVKGLSIPVVRSNIIAKGLSTSIFRINKFGERYIHTYRTNA